jgi:cyanophycin synthetase
LFDRLKAFALRRNSGRQAADRQLTKFYEKIWQEAALSVGATIEPLGCGVFEIRRGAAHTRVLANSTAIDDLATHVIVRTKTVIYRLLAQEGLPTARYLEFGLDEINKAVAFMESMGVECVVKPAGDTGGGLGVTTGIRKPWHLARAAWAAGRQGSDLVIEEQIEGDNYRLLYLDGELLDAIVRKPPVVTADGRSTVEQLVQAANQARLTQGYPLSHGILTFDLDMQRTLAKQGLTLASVPSKGTVVTLKTAINENSAPDNVTVTHLLCDAIIEEGARAARTAGVRLAGVDIITSNLAVSLREVGGVILEVNSPPGYYWHYHKRDGSFPVAVHVLEKLLGK